MAKVSGTTHIEWIGLGENHDWKALFFFIIAMGQKNYSFPIGNQAIQYVVGTVNFNGIVNSTLGLLSQYSRLRARMEVECR